MSVRKRVITDMPSTSKLSRQEAELIEERATITSQNVEWYKVKSDSTDNLPGNLDDKAGDSLTVDKSEHKLTLKGDRSNLKNLDVYYGVDGDGEYGFWTLDDVLDRISFKPKGVYDPKFVYNKMDVVAYNGGLYACLFYHVKGKRPTNHKYWRLLLSSSWLVEEENKPKPEPPVHHCHHHHCCHHRRHVRNVELINAIIRDKKMRKPHRKSEEDNEEDGD